MHTQYTEVDFDSRFWESCSVWRITLPFGSPFEHKVDELVLDLDYTVELLADGSYWHAPAVLEFHGVTDLNVNFFSGDSEFQNAPSGFLFEAISRQLIQPQKVFFDRPYYGWTLQLVAPPQSGQLAFGAYGFTFRVAEAIISKPHHSQLRHIR
ncbi:hypothetical protein IAD21_02069 [Abditibacteriota bacterium]|nr:hypothetical protein IAD21_02069 [Abditibacteriota bacterium]